MQLRRRLSLTSGTDVKAFLNELGLEDALDSFSGRIRIQKTVYLLKAFSDEMKFGYTWYFRGPYSPSLTKALFEAERPGQKRARKLTSDELKIVSEVRRFLEQDFYSADRMELIASLLYLVRHGPEYGLTTKAEILRFLKDEKPQYTPREIDGVWNRIVGAKRWNNYLSELGE